MPRAMLSVVLRASALVMVALTLAAAPASAADKAVCIGQLGRDERGGMAEVTSDWRRDFLGFDIPPGGYAQTIAQLRTGCPTPPPAQ